MMNKPNGLKESDFKHMELSAKKMLGISKSNNKSVFGVEGYVITDINEEKVLAFNFEIVDEDE